MKILHLTIAILCVAVMGSDVSAKTDLDGKTIAPFLKKRSGENFRSTPTPHPLPLPAPAVSRGISATSRSYFGIEAGITGGMFIGGDVSFTFDYPLDDLDRGVQFPLRPVDEHGFGIGFAIGGVLDLALSDALGFQSKLGYKALTASGSKIAPFTCFSNGSSAESSVEDAYDITISTIGVDLLGRYQFMTDGLYGLLGVGASGILAASTSGTQEFLSSPNGCQYNNASGVRTGQTRLEMETDRYIDSVNRMRFDLRFGMGTWIPLGDNGTMLVPEITAGIPLSSFFTTSVASKDGRDLPSLAYLSLSVAIKFPWGANSSTDQGLSERQPDNTIFVGGATTHVPGKAHLSGRVVNNSGEMIPDAAITVVDLITNQIVGKDKTSGGIYNVQVVAPGIYSVTADAPGYLFGSSYFEVDSDGRILKHSGDIRLAPSNDGRVRLLVFFDFDKATLQSSSNPELIRAADLMKANPSMRVEIAGFTDSRGAEQYNKDLSQRRANTVREFIVQQGVEPTRLVALGYGAANPIATNDTEVGRADNRRVEFVVQSR